MINNNDNDNKINNSVNDNNDNDNKFRKVKWSKGKKITGLAEKKAT